jgi:MoaA/NifB/PqqE/SkfB family radical SAM enzyme
MARKREFLDKELAMRLINEIAAEKMTDKPLQLHLMGEPFLYPHLREVIEHIHHRGFPVRLFTNGALLTQKNQDMIFETGIGELVIGIHTFNSELYETHRRGKPDFGKYMSRIRETIEEKFLRGSELRIFLQYLNTKHYNRSRREKGYSRAVIPLVDEDQKALELIDEWKDFGREISLRYSLGFEPLDLECLQGAFRTAPLDCLKGNHCEILPAVILHFKDIGTFADYLMKSTRYVERYKYRCPSIEEHVAILASGDCTPCCVDYDGRMTVGNVRQSSIAAVLESRAMRQMQAKNRQGLLPSELCRICMAILVEDDYGLKFPGEEDEAYTLERGFYSLEGKGHESFRWTGKRAILILGKDAKMLVLEVKNGHLLRQELSITVQQGERKQTFILKDNSWTKIFFEFEDRKKVGERVILESEDFWIPAEVLEGSEDGRELGVMVKSIRLVREV